MKGEYVWDTMAVYGSGALWDDAGAKPAFVGAPVNHAAAYLAKILREPPPTNAEILPTYNFSTPISQPVAEPYADRAGHEINRGQLHHVCSKGNTVTNARSLLEEFIAFAFRDPVVAAEMFTEDGIFEIPYLASFGTQPRCQAVKRSQVSSVLFLASTLVLSSRTLCFESKLLGNHNLLIC